MTQCQNFVRGHYLFAVFWIASLIVFWRTIHALVVFSLNDETCSHILVIPLVSAFLVIKERAKIFSVHNRWAVAGIGIVLMGAAAYGVAVRAPAFEQGKLPLSLATLAVVLVWIGGFICFYGLDSARKALFSLLFLFLMVPLPERVLAWTIHLLQLGSTELSYRLFNVLGVPVLRQGFLLSLPSVTIEVASECSGIRSSMALLITCLLAAHFYLRTKWKTVAFLLLVFPVALIKNAVRIVTLTLLTIYVDPSFLRGSLHREGGVLFFGLAVLLVLPLLFLLQKSERVRVLSRSQQP